MAHKIPGREFLNPNRVRLTSKKEYLISKIFSPIVNVRSLVRILATIGSFFEFVDVILPKSSKGNKVKMFPSREKLWLEMIGDLNDSKIVGLEFGVAWGYTSAFWLANFSNPQLTWVGFDRFLGLPLDWDEYKVGAFSTDGVPPRISDSRVLWRKGDVEDTFNDEFLSSITHFERRVVFFDLDLYEPSEFVWSKLGSHLKPGDLIYFDEARIIDERFLIKKFVLPTKNLRIIGISLNSAAFEVQ